MRRAKRGSCSDYLSAEGVCHATIQHVPPMCKTFCLELEAVLALVLPGKLVELSLLILKVEVQQTDLKKKPPLKSSWDHGPKIPEFFNHIFQLH